MKSLLKKLVSYILQIGADTQDSEYIRLAKRIWCVSLVFSILTCLGISILEFRAGEKFLGAVFFFSLVPFLLALIHGALRPRHYERNAFILQTYLIIVAMVVTLALGGMQKANGATLIGLLGPLFALFFPRKSRAVLLFVLYAALYLGLVFLAIFSWDSISLQSHLADLLFWFGFLSVAGFAFGATYFFVDQRDKVYRLLEKEKERSEEFLRRIKKDLEEAAQIQKNFLPQENPQLEGYEISGLNVPCYEVGGDYFDYVPIDADRLGVVIADVAGKGIGASLLMASLRAALLQEILLQYEIAPMVARLNDFVSKSSRPNIYITFFYGELVHRSGELQYVNAGHNPPFAISARGQLSALGTSGLALGMLPSQTYESGTVRLAPGDIIVFFTDGIPERRNAQREQFTEGRLKSLILNHTDLSAAQICEKIIGDVQSFAAGADPSDDITLVVIKREPDGTEGAS